MTKLQILVDALSSSGKNKFSRADVLQVASAAGVDPSRFLDNPVNKVARNVYTIGGNTPEVKAPAPVVVPISATQVMLTQPKLKVEINNLVPNRDKTYVPFGFYKDLTTIISSKAFYPTFITGMSGNGKTTMIEQVCAALRRECIRVNISIETDEDDLIGGNTLIDGNVVYRDGPVTLGAKRGSVVIVDEIDRGSNKLMCLQGILEGKPFFNKKTGEVIYPQPGFNIIATANTKGQGSDDGKYMAAQILDDAFLERFAITVEQEYPSPKIEKKIIIKKMERVEKIDEDFADKLVQWAEIIRKTFKEGAIDELISTRRLEHIVNAFAMFGDRMKAINLCTARFNEETKTAFLDLYTKVDEGVEMPSGEHTIDNEAEETVPSSF